MLPSKLSHSITSVFQKVMTLPTLVRGRNASNAMLQQSLDESSGMQEGQHVYSMQQSTDDYSGMQEGRNTHEQHLGCLSPTCPQPDCRTREAAEVSPQLRTHYDGLHGSMGAWEHGRVLCMGAPLDILLRGITAIKLRRRF